MPAHPKQLTIDRKGSDAAEGSDTPRPPNRFMSVIAQAPSIRKGGKIVMATVSIPAEELRPGPVGYRVQVVDFDATTRTFHGSHVLPASYSEEPANWRVGHPSIVSNLRFHAQNTYALVMKTLARFEFALGRRIGWSFDTHQLKVAPHGMADANAYYAPGIEGLVFGYFRGVTGDRVYTCLSHDIIVHEATHALLDALRERYMDASTPDQGAFHEGFSDVVALLSVFSLPEVVRHLLADGSRPRQGVPTMTRRSVRPESLRRSALFGLADGMGSELEGIRGEPLRASAALQPSKKHKELPEFQEPHRRGELFVAAVLHGFIECWSARILASGVTQQKHFPLDRVAEEGARIADTLATMWIRAIDYMPPVHLEFGDALSAALTADLEVRPDDSRYHLRHHMLTSFAGFGFAPASTRADRSGIWAPAPAGLRYDRVRSESMRSDKDEVFKFIWENRDLLQLRDGAFTQVLSVRPSVRTGIDGFIVRETVAEYYQVARLTPDEMKAVGVRAPAGYLRALARAAKRRTTRTAAIDAGDAHDHAPAATDEGSDDDTYRANTTPLYGGGILIFDEYGRVKYWVHNDVFGSKQRGRLEYLWREGLLQLDTRGTKLRRTPISEIHRIRALNSTSSSPEKW
jgi:hypothetical protein